MIRAVVIALLIVSSAKSGFAKAPARAEKAGSDAAEPIDLFNGKNLDGWTTLDGKPVKKGWQVEDGVLHRKSRGGHIVTDETYRDFDLRFEWKIAKGGNSGVKYRLKKIKGRWLGCEYQLYDDRGRSGSASSTGALYALYPPPKDKPLNPPGKFNNSRIVVRDGHVAHWLNGEKIVEAEIGSEDWNRRVDRSKFNKYPGFAETEQTKIMLQDHGKEVWFRKITIRRLDSSEMAKAGNREHAAIDFNQQIRPILSNACYACHGPDANTREADLRLDTRAEAFADRGGYHAIVPGKPGASEMIKRLKSDDEYMKMPPPDAHQQVTNEQIDLVERWIASGAEWQDHWSLIPPEAVASPQVKNESWPRNPIDAFILDRLESEGLAHSKPANKETLLRRVTLDLTGLPPTLDELDAFLTDDSPTAYEKVVDRLLASPRYGEHMARYWLDAARYSDSNGYQQERTRTMWPWRNWVVRALNANMPYDQFTIEQLAGDLLQKPSRDQLVATGFHRNHMLNGEGGRIAEESRVEYVVDRVETTGTVWLGLTAGCARCHDHKFDQLTQNEFYGLYAFFNNIDETGRVDRGGNAKPVLPLPTEEQLTRQNSLETERSQLQARLESASEEEKKSLKKELEKNKKALENLKKSYRVTMIMKNREKPRETYRLKRGQWDQPDKSQEILPGVPASFPPLPETGEGERHNRLDLARWLVSPNNPLTARVAVNRDWQHFFGTGLVKTAEDFGTQGERPSHPKLLDWLAVRFMTHDWDRKALHRLIVTSAAYRQSSKVDSQLAEQDPENRLLGRGPRYRLSSLALRDQALYVAGLLVEKSGGPPVKPYQPDGVWSDLTLGKIHYQQDHGEKLYRRSLYTFWRRSVGPTMFFDTSARQVCTVRLARTNTPLHALTLMNDITFIEAARVLAERLLKQEHSTPEERLTRAFRLATSRYPTSEELQTLMDVLKTVRSKYQDQPDVASRILDVGEAARDQSLDQTEHAAYTAVVNMILNLDEVLTKE